VGIAPVRPGCPQYNCVNGNPMGELYYTELGLQAGTPSCLFQKFVGSIPSSAAWLLLDLRSVRRIGQPCVEGSTPVPNTGAQFDFSFGNGFLSTAREPGAHFVTVYFVGCDLPNAEDCGRRAPQAAHSAQVSAGSANCNL
jgi:hypothetical protein